VSRRHRKFFERADDSDPLVGLTNLFDIAIVFAVALMVALVQRLEMSELLTEQDVTIVKNPGTPEMKIVVKDGAEIKSYGVDAIKSETGQKGRRVGTAFQLDDGTIIYVPDSEGAESGTKPK